MKPIKNVTLIALVFAAIARIGAQAPVRDTVAEARRLHDAGNLAAVEGLLRPYLASHPDNGDAARILAQTLYWLNRQADARTLYDAAMARHPEDVTLRVDYGRMLKETGDLTTAARLFGDALRADSTQKEARRQLAEIMTLTASWVRAAATWRHDDQTLDQFGGDVQAGWYATPLLALSARVRPMEFHLGDSVTRTVTVAELVASDYFPEARLETEVAGGVLQRSYGASSDWAGRLALGFRLPQHLTFRFRAEREPYLYTLASLSTPVMTQTLAATLDLNGSHGWLGQATAQQDRYPDANSVRTAYAWVLAPLVYNATGELQIGYSITAQNSDQSRFVLANSSQAFSPGNPRFSLLGVYVPYYTPDNLLAQSVLIAFARKSSSGFEFRGSAAVGVHATDDAPVFNIVSTTSPTTSTVQRVFVPRVFTPWNIRGSLAAPLSDAWRLDVIGEYAHTVFYTSATASVQLTYKFLAGAKRLAERH
ncbi:MAG TPA: hypothetical protein VGQ30_07750 [Gemmatimonadaceae bacterium]|nr:hypothetical protein [Gemmatimonadaceae bacterium]